MSFALNTSAFRNGGEIPSRYTCSGSDISPALKWSGSPKGTRSLALIVDDPDAPMGTWTHWLIWNIPAQPPSLPGGVPADGELRNGARQGRNDFNRLGYGGPCPPPGKAHRYFFRICAVDTLLELKPGGSRSDLERALKGHVVSQAVWMGTFRR